MQRRQPQPGSSRRGSLIPAVAAALLVVGAAMALVLDRLWIDTAAIELRAAAEAAALAGAARLADDERLRTDVDVQDLHHAVRDRAADVTLQNFAAGSPVVIDRGPGVDVLVGRLVRDDSGRNVFLETDDANAVAVLAQRTRSRSNPVALFLNGLTGRGSADVLVTAEATVDNRVLGVQPIDGAAVPMLPLAILEIDPAGVRTDTWVVQIEQRGGADQWSYDDATNAVRPQADGIPEITLRSAPIGSDAQEQAQANLRCVDLGNQLGDRAIALQVQNGVTSAHLAAWGGALRFDQGPVVLDSSSVVAGGPHVALEQSVGQPRICLLYAQPSTTFVSETPVTVTRLVAGRVMSVTVGSEGDTQIVFQPCVLTTRTAILPDAVFAGDTASAFTNPYIYKLHLTQ
jgi:hypothetical protein